MECIFIYVVRRSSERRTGGRNDEREVAELSPWCSYEQKSVIFHTPSKCHVYTCVFVRARHTGTYTRVLCFSSTKNINPTGIFLAFVFHAFIFSIFFRDSLSLSLSFSLNCFPREWKWTLVSPLFFPSIVFVP